MSPEEYQRKQEGYKKIYGLAQDAEKRAWFDTMGKL